VLVGNQHAPSQDRGLRASTNSWTPTYAHNDWPRTIKFITVTRVE